METGYTDTNWVAKIRQNYNLLLFLVTTSIPMALWGLLMLMDFFDGILLTDPNKVGMDLFMIFIFPLIAAPFISGFALFIAKLLSIRGIRFLVVVGLGVVIPIIAFVLVYASHLITRKLYTGKMMSKGARSLSGEPTDKMEQLKGMLEKELISQKDYELKKADILARM